jgi:nucleotide-binding universal stress UspA family protein
MRLARSAQAKCSMKLDRWQSGSGYLHTSCMFRIAHPATAIIETAKSRGCDLVVMASHGRRGLKKLFLGSQTSEVLVAGNIPVLVVH